MAGQVPEGNDSPQMWRNDAPASSSQPPPPPPTSPQVDPRGAGPGGAGPGGAGTGSHRIHVAIGVALALVVATVGFVLLRADDDRNVGSTDATDTQITDTAVTGDQSGSSAASPVTSPVDPAATDGPSDSSRVDRVPEIGVATTVPEPATVPETIAPTTIAPTTVALPIVPPSTLLPLTTQPPPVTLSAPRIVEAAASSTRPDATDGCDPPNATTYSANQLFDRFTDSAWMTVGAGVGAEVEFTLQSAATVSYVGLIAGYTKVDPCRGFDRFLDLRRIVRVRWSFDDGTSVEQVVDPEVRTVQYFQIAPSVTTATVRLTILETTEPGNDNLDYTPISEVEIL